MELQEKIQELDAQLANATYTERRGGLYEVFVPGAVRQKTTVSAESEKEARSKVRANLLSKIEHFHNKAEATGESDGILDVENAQHRNESRIEGEA